MCRNCQSLRNDLTDYEQRYEKMVNENGDWRRQNEVLQVTRNDLEESIRRIRYCRSARVSLVDFKVYVHREEKQRTEEQLEKKDYK